MRSKRQRQIERLARAAKISFSEVWKMCRAPSARAVLAGGAEVAVPLEGLIDFAQERERLACEREKLQKEAGKLEAQLANPQFAERAPAEKVERVRERLTDIAQRTAALQQMMEALEMNWLDEGALFSQIGAFLSRRFGARRHHDAGDRHAQLARAWSLSRQRADGRRRTGSG